MELFHLKKFSELNTDELYDLLQLRSQVFIIEQNCNYLDPDGKDKHSLHLFYKKDKQIIAYCRILPQGLSYEEASIGRVCVHPDYRGKEYGRKLFQKACEICEEYFPATSIRISAQTYLIPFYESYGFICQGEEYLEDKLPHIQMLLAKI